jgi:transcriptional regulator with XRE-family HTH domain
MNKPIVNVEIDGSRLKVERESQGMSLKDLALKVCLSHQHITQLENNQSVIFFTTAHKIQVAKKVGKALGLEETDYLIHQVPDQDNASSTSISDELQSSTPLPISNDLFAKANVKLTINQKKSYIKPTLVFSSLAICIGLVAFTTDFPSIQLVQSLETLLKPTPAPAVIQQTEVEPAMVSAMPELPNSTTNQEAELKKVSLNNDPSACAYQSQGISVYRTSNPSKSAEMVYIQSKDRQTVCIIDNQNKSVPLDLDAGQSRSVYGQAPLTVISSNLSKLDIYFQGWKVKLPDTETTSIRLEPTELAQN